MLPTTSFDDDEVKSRKLFIWERQIFGRPSAALCKNGHEVYLVVTQPDKPKGRGKLFLSHPVKEEALKQGSRYISRKKIRDPELWKF